MAVESASVSPGPRPIRAGLFVLDGPDGAPALVGSRCPDCGRHFYPTREVCLGCGHVGLDQAHLSTDGEIWSYTVVRQKPPASLIDIPYVLAQVALPEKVRVQSVVTDCDPESISIGTPVTLHTFPISRDEEGNDLIAFSFRPR